MAARLVASQPREDFVYELGAIVRPEALEAATDIDQVFLHRRDHIRRDLATEGVEPTHARRVFLEQGQVQSLPSRRDFPGAGNVNENAVGNAPSERKSPYAHARRPFACTHPMHVTRVLVRLTRCCLAVSRKMPS